MAHLVSQNHPAIKDNLGLFSNLQSDTALILVFTAIAVFSLFLIFNIFPALMLLLILVFYTAIVNRFFAFYDGPDTMFISILFCALLLEFNIKSTPSLEKNPFPNELNLPFAYLFLFQISLIYFFNGINKTDICWWKGEAAKIMLSDVLINKTAAKYVVSNNTYICFFTYFTLFFEITFPLFVFINRKFQNLRYFLIFEILCFHWGIFIFTDVGLYPFLGTLCAAILLPSSFWKKMGSLKKLTFYQAIQLPQIPFQLIIRNSIFKYFASLIAVIFLFKTTLFSLNKQNMYYKFQEQPLIANLYTQFKSNPSSPFAQSWGMFAPKPHSTNGFITFEVMSDSTHTVTPINPFDTNTNFKSFPSNHPFRICLEFAFIKISNNKHTPIVEWQLENIAKYIRNNSKQHSMPIILNTVMYVFREENVNKRAEKEISKTILFVK